MDVIFWVDRVKMWVKKNKTRTLSLVAVVLRRVLRWVIMVAYFTSSRQTMNFHGGFFYRCVIYVLRFACSFPQIYSEPLTTFSRTWPFITTYFRPSGFSFSLTTRSLITRISTTTDRFLSPRLPLSDILDHWLYTLSDWFLERFTDYLIDYILD